MFIYLVLLIMAYFYIHQYYLEWKYKKLYPIDVHDYLQKNHLKLVVSKHPFIWNLEILHQKMEVYK